MHCIKYRIHAINPLVFSSKYGDINMVLTKRYIPGSTVLGLLAKRFIEKEGHSTDNVHENEFFYNNFLMGELTIENAYIVSEDDDNICYYPVPLSIIREKNGTDIYDRLFLDEWPKYESLDKFCSIDNEDGHINTKSVETALNFHHARDRDRGTSKESLIFNYESISPDQTFEGKIIGEPSVLKELIYCCQQSFIAYAGRSKNNQYGQVRFEIMDHQPELIQPEENFLDSKDTISLTLLSDTIIYNKFGFSVTDKQDFEDYLGGSVKILKAFTRRGHVETFVSKWQLKRSSESCFLAGSSFLLDISNADKSRLEQLAIQGIGERRHEGFGSCAFGLQKSKLLIEIKSDSDEFEEPDGQVPDKTIEILTTIIQNHMIKKTRIMAFSDQRNFHKLPKKSLINKLEAMIKNKDRLNMIQNLENLNQTAKQNLKQCVNQKETLYDYLQQADITAEKVFNELNNLNLENMCKKIKYKPENDKSLDRQLFQTYFSTFFSMMRKNKT